MRHPIFLILTLLSIAGCCSPGESRDVAVPRKEAYPRMTIPDAVYRTDTIAELPVKVNRASQSSRETEGWMTVTYNDPKAEVFMTLTSFNNNMEDAVANRLERLSMNTGGATTEVEEFVNHAGRNCLLMITPAGCPTPVQFIAVAEGEWMLSGSAVVEGIATATGDSLKPVVEMLHRDVSYMLHEL